MQVIGFPSLILFFNITSTLNLFLQIIHELRIPTPTQILVTEVARRDAFVDLAYGCLRPRLGDGMMFLET